MKPQDTEVKIAPRDSVIAEHFFETNISAIPNVKDTVIFKVFNEVRAGIETPHVEIYGTLRREGSNHFETKVTWI